MPEKVNTRILLQERPSGRPTPEHFRLDAQPLPELDRGQVQVATEALGIDAFIITTLGESGFHRRSGVEQAVSALGVGKVEASADPSLAVGDMVFGPLGAQTHPTVPAAAMRKLDTTVAPATTYLGALGMTTGVTAYVGIRSVGRPQPGETVVVSAAAGAVGSIAAQVAKLDGATVIGIAGGPAKSAFLTEDLGLDAAIDYKNDDVGARLSELAPDGVDVFFDNVGNPILDIVLEQIAERARVVICGAIAQYGREGDTDGPSHYLKLAERYARMEGFTVLHFSDQWAAAEAQLAAWLDAGQLVMRETVLEGIDQFPRALATLFDGGHTGKLLLRP